MNWWYLGAGILVLLLGWQLSQADSITTTIASQGAAFLSSSLSGEDGSYRHTLFTTDNAELFRNLQRDDSISAQVKVSGTGVIGIDEYGSQDRRNEGEGLLCLLAEVSDPPMKDIVRSFGMLQSGTYLSDKEFSDERSESETMINGTGEMILFSRSAGENGTSQAKTYASGPMEVTESVSFGGDDA